MLRDVKKSFLARSGKFAEERLLGPGPIMNNGESETPFELFISHASALLNWDHINSKKLS
jgi:hypothetical protein